MYGGTWGSRILQASQLWPPYWSSYPKAFDFYHYCWALSQVSRHLQGQLASRIKLTTSDYGTNALTAGPLQYFTFQTQGQRSIFLDYTNNTIKLQFDVKPLVIRGSLNPLVYWAEFGRHLILISRGHTTINSFHNLCFNLKGIWILWSLHRTKIHPHPKRPCLLLQLSHFMLQLDVLGDLNFSTVTAQNQNLPHPKRPCLLLQLSQFMIQ